MKQIPQYQPKSQIKLVQSINQSAQQNEGIQESHAIRVLSKEVKAVEKMQLTFKGKEDIKKYQKMKKKHRYRKNVIAEIINTEKAYVNDLKVICETVIQQGKNILTKDDLETIFMNCEQIYIWNKQFLQTMEIGYKQYNVDKSQMPKPYQIVFEETNLLLKNQEIGFKCYYEYCSKFTKSNKVMEQLKANDQTFKNFLTQLNQSGALRGMDLGSFLVKPVQRLPKYILLFKDLEKNTDDDYPDLKNIKNIHKYFRDVNEENNKTMDIFISRIQIQQICDQYHINAKEILDDQNRTYKFEEKLTIIQPNSQKNEDCQISIHALNDMLILIHDEKFLKKIKLDSLSFVKNQSESNKYFSYLFQIVGVGDTIQCIAEKEQSKKKYIEQFEKLIQENREYEYSLQSSQGKEAKMRYPVQVVVVGTEERNFQSFTKHTQYITEISINKIFQNIFIRYSEIEQMHSKYKKKYPQIEFTQLPDKNWLMSHKTKSIEARKLAIENFLQTLLQAKEIQLDKELLNELKLPENFFDLPQLFKAQLVSVFPQKPVKGTTLEGLDELKEKGIKIDKLKTSAGEILKAVEIEKFQRKRNVVDICPNKVCQFQEGESNKIYKVIITLPDGTESIIGVSEQARVSEVLKYVTHFNHFQYYQDFRLYLIDQLKKQRVLDQDEVLYKVVQEEKQNNQGLLNKLEQLLAKSNQEVIVKVKKYIYMPPKLEESDYKEDPVRLINMAFSILDDVHEQKLQLGFKEYCLFGALYFHMKYGNINDSQFEEVKRVIPNEMYQSSTEKEWKELVNSCFQSLHQQLQAISKKNKEDKESKKPNWQLKHTDPKFLAALVTLNAARTFVQSSMAIFQVQTYEATQKFFKNAGREIYPTIYLGLSIHKLHFLNPQRKEEFRQFFYDDIDEVKSYPSQIILTMRKYKEPLRFDTYQSYEIKSLIEQYKALQHFDEEYGLQHNFNCRQ